MNDTTATSYTVNYIDTCALAAEIQKFYDTGIPTDILGNYILAIANGVLQNDAWRGYSTTWRDDMLSESVANMWNAIDKKWVKTDKYAFGYLNRITWNTCKRIVTYSKGRQMGLEEYTDFAKHMGLAYDLDENVNSLTKDEAEDDLYEYCCTDH